ncbi:uncharacterized protein LOC128386253 [Panonychus citri]|uniref:uncharacterized protein LOC128386253 n=1 Tax=Panonychus citri TaxID=50023 RepID=UPI00230823A5|nr:uncharacterized protein LOC128386253 [Panonychus citri]
MLLNDLPDDCLWLIFDKFFKLEELIQLSKVCSKWSNLISIRLKKVKYLVNWFDVHKHDYSKIWMENPNTLSDYNLQELLPNLRIVNFPFVSVGQASHAVDVRKVVNDNPKIKGLIRINSRDSDSFNGHNLENIEMISMKSLDFDYKKIFRPDQLKQIHLYDASIDELPKCAEYFPNLKRLNISFCGGEVDYYGPEFTNLKILELNSYQAYGTYNGFRLMDSCPYLTSAFMRLPIGNVNTDEAKRNYNLKDLVIDLPMREFPNFTWSHLRKLLSKYPNLQNLAIRKSEGIGNNHVEKLVRLLPEIKLLDLRSCENVTGKSADFLSKFCLESKRSIKIYYDCEKEPDDWPKYDTPRESIVYGFNFMKHCFYKSFSSLPNVIDE